MAKQKRGLDYLGMSLPLETVQPDYARWQAVQNGMSFDEVVEILGPPAGPRPNPIGLSSCCYGKLGMPLMPYVYCFRLWFQNDQLYNKQDPFDGVFSTDGKPAKPHIITPPRDAVFRYEPYCGDAPYSMRRPYVIDMRWHPVSGVYPMLYELELGTVSNRGDPFGYVMFPQKMPIPYFVWSWQTPLPGCFRVRGVNRVGVGEWSDYRYFDFRVHDAEAASDSAIS